MDTRHSISEYGLFLSLKGSLPLTLANSPSTREIKSQVIHDHACRVRKVRLSQRALPAPTLSPQDTEIRIRLNKT